MNILPYYKKASSLFIILSPWKNKLFKLIPPKKIVKRKTEKLLFNFNKKIIKEKFVKLLGDFSNYNDYCTEKENIILSANKILNHEFQILGSGCVKLEAIDWHIDFKSGFRWPKDKFYQDYIQVDLSNNADVKVPRELSRGHHLLWLGQAYLLTKNEKYTKEFIFQINNWIDENPLMRSINWGCAMDVSIRAVNWMYALNMMLSSDNVTDSFVKKITHSLFEHGWFIYRNLEKGVPNSGNHYASNIVGLLFLGSFFKAEKEGANWFKFGLQEYYNEIRNQILPSGPQFEKSTSYHRLVTELFLYSYIFLKRQNLNIPLDIRYRIKKMLDFTLYYIKPNGKAPLIGDEDNGRLLPFLEYEIIDHRYLLSLGAIEFNNSLYKKYSRGYVSDAFFLLGVDGKVKFNEIDSVNDTLQSKAFPDAGFCVLRHDDFYIFINNSGTAKYSDTKLTGGSHAHADMLSFELAIGKTSFIVDPGSYVYTSSAKDRNLFRSTAMHNTVTIDKKDQHTLPNDDLFMTKDIGKPVIFEFDFNDRFDKFIGSHNGYQKLKNGVIHKREILFSKENKQFEIIDSLIGNGEHEINWYFHFGDKIDVKSFNGYIEATSMIDNQSIKLEFETKINITINVLDSFISTSYGTKSNTKSVRINANSNGPCSMKTNIYLLKKIIKN